MLSALPHDMVFTDQMHCTRLRSIISLRLIKAHLVAYLQLIEIGIDHTVAVKVDVAAIGGIDTPIVLIGNQY